MNYLEFQQLKELVNKLVNDKTKYDTEDILFKTRQKIIDLMTIIVYRDLERGGRTIEHILISDIEREIIGLERVEIKRVVYVRAFDLINKLKTLKLKKIFNY